MESVQLLLTASWVVVTYNQDWESKNHSPLQSYASVHAEWMQGHWVKPKLALFFFSICLDSYISRYLLWISHAQVLGYVIKFSHL